MEKAGSGGHGLLPSLLCPFVSPALLTAVQPVLGPGGQASPRAPPHLDPLSHAQPMSPLGAGLGSRAEGWALAMLLPLHGQPPTMELWVSKDRLAAEATWRPGLPPLGAHGGQTDILSHGCSKGSTPPTCGWKAVVLLGTTFPRMPLGGATWLILTNGMSGRDACTTSGWGSLRAGLVSCLGGACPQRAASPSWPRGSGGGGGLRATPETWRQVPSEPRACRGPRGRVPGWPDRGRMGGAPS